MMVYSIFFSLLFHKLTKSHQSMPRKENFLILLNSLTKAVSFLISYVGIDAKRNKQKLSLKKIDSK